MNPTPQTSGDVCVAYGGGSAVSCTGEGCRWWLRRDEQNFCRVHSSRLETKLFLRPPVEPVEVVKATELAQVVHAPQSKEHSAIVNEARRLDRRHNYRH